MKRAVFFLVPVLALSFLGMAKKQTTVMVRFHTEANARDGESFAIPAKFHNPTRDGFIEKVASLSERDVVAIYPVAAQDDTFGCVFQFDRHGSIGLQTLSTDKQGAVIVPIINTKAGARQLPEMRIDKPITDGIIYVPRGLHQNEIDELQKQYPTMGAPARRK